MPGKKQLKQFSKDVLELGDEVNVRSMRGEKPAVFSIPENIPETNDSKDFVLGMPDPDDTNSLLEDSNASSESDSLTSDNSNPLIPNIPLPEDDFASGLAETPNLDDILNSVSNPNPVENKQDTNFADMDLDDLLGNLDSPKSNENNASNFDLDEPEVLEDIPEIEEALPADETPLESAEPEKTAPVDDVSTENVYDPNADFEDDISTGSNLDGIDLTSELPKELNEVSGTEEFARPKIDEVFPIENNEEKVEKTEDSDFADLKGFEEIEPEAEEVEPAAEEVEEPESLDEVESLDSLDNIENAENTLDGDTESPSVEAAPENVPAEALSASEDITETPKDDSSDLFDMPDLDSFGLDDISSDSETTEPAPEEAVPEIFDTPELDDIDFSANSGNTEGSDADSTAKPDSNTDLSDFDIPETDAKLDGDKSDFDIGLEDEFSIPGFSDTDEVQFDKIAQAQDQINSFDNPQEESKATEAEQKNSLTEEEYARFKKNLSEYPLNVRIAIEDAIVKNEFKDEAIFDVIHRILKKQSARQVASHLEKMLDISLSVPRDFEHRTVAEYELYKQTLEYQLKNRIIPTFLIGLGAAFILFFLFIMGRQFLYRPLKARSLYKQGYVLLESDAYPQADQKFRQAVGYRPSKGWFYKYARGYREHKQYERSSLVYNDILKRFNNDKPAGLEYADMQWKDLVDYEGAVRIINDRMLLYHVNDADGILKLGDIYLDWGDNVDQSKYENARENYASLINLYGATDTYLSRMLRYFIRKDNLSEVLRLKEVFYPRKKSLGSQDLTDLSGYMFDKATTTLSPAEKYLQDKITDIRELMERAIRADPKNPVALYNMARYFLNMSSTNDALKFLDISQQEFENAERLKKADIYKRIDSYRLEGEIYVDQQEILKAAEAFTQGISIFRNNTPALPGTYTVGKMYSNLADIDYFKYNDSDAAYNNYQAAIENQNDTPENRYKIGAILYEKNKFPEALGVFINTAELVPNDNNLLMALGNVLMQRNSYYAAKGYYEELVRHLDSQRAERGLLLPQANSDDSNLVDSYMKVSNNLGVALYSLAKRTGNSSLNGQALVKLSDSLRAWDALTRNQESMVRLPGVNLAEQNIQYITKPISSFEPAIYPDIPRTLESDKGLK